PPPPPPPSTAAVHGHPSTGHMEERRHMSYDNGPGPQLYRQPSYPPPPHTPLSHPGGPTTPYEQTQMYPPPPMGPDGTYPPISYAATAGKRKSQRASQACDSCRQLKAKCDENKPCKNCQEKNIVCNYRDPAPKQQDKATQDILEAVQKLLLADRREILGELSKSLPRVVDNALVVDTNRAVEIPRASEMHHPVSPPTQMAEIEETVLSSPGEGPPANGNIPDPEAATKRIRQMETEDEADEPPGQTVRPQEAPFPHDHTTPAGRLLSWPSIRRIVGPMLDKEGIKYIDNYPQRREESRGQLPLFGRGDGSTKSTTEPVPTYEYLDLADDSSQAGDHPSPSTGTDWGPIGGPSPPGSLPSDLHAKVSRTDSPLDFDEGKVWKYVGSYKTHIQNMHPLIPPEDLDAMVVSFLDDVGARKSKSQAKFVSAPEGAMQSATSDFDRKRKRSPGPNGAEPGPPSKRSRPQRSSKHALVLLVLALGKICSWRERKLPEAVDKDSAPSHGSPIVRNGHVTSPNQSSPPASAVSQSPGQAGLPSPKDHDRSIASRRSSVQASGISGPTSAASPAPLKRNYEVIPGLEYFAYATDILGNHFGSYELSQIQAHILACLYYGQLGRVLASFRHIRFACQMIVDKLQPQRLSRFLSFDSGRVVSLRDNKYLVTFWTCCQLESDILAELNLLPSGILQYEGLLPYPDMTVLHDELGFSEEVVNSYMAQLYLRKRMNEISGQLYNPKHRPVYDEQVDITHNIELMLAHKDVWAMKFAFDVKDDPSEDILHARFRAKFWGANVITYRPYIENIMRWCYGRCHPEEARDLPQCTLLRDYMHVKNPDELPPGVLDNARKGIAALMQSTQAFHGLKDKRFIITNVFGTAHAQWGNLITLRAAYEDPVLGPEVDEPELRHMLRKTIEFLEVVAQDSSSLAVDLRILKGL
ncbi:hypothetical protein M406DRAFT_216035, partial [Cryphonectria parasitica EP155]